MRSGRFSAGLLTVWLLVGAGLMVALPFGCTAAEGSKACEVKSFEVTQFREGYRPGFYPDVSGDRVVWNGVPAKGVSEYEIFTWTTTDGLLRITDDGLEDMAARVSGNRVVWQRNMASDGGVGPEGTAAFDFEIFTWTPAGGIVRITQNDWWDRGPQVSGDRVVWSGRGGTDGGDDWEIFTWTPEGGTVQLTQNDLDDGGVSVSGDRIVWQRSRFNGESDDSEIFCWTPAEGTVQLTDNSYYDGGPSVSGDRVVWSAGVDSEGADGPEKILTWTPDSGVTHISSGRDLGMASVSGDLVAWMGRGGSDGGSDFEIFTWTPSEEVSQLTENDMVDIGLRVSDELVVWVALEGRGVSGEGVVMAWPVGSSGRGQILGPTGDGMSEAPSVSGNRVVWRNTDFEITMAVYGGQ